MAMVGGLFAVRVPDHLGQIHGL